MRQETDRYIDKQDEEVSAGGAGCYTHDARKLCLSAMISMVSTRVFPCVL